MKLLVTPLTETGTYIDYQPGNGTRYDTYITPVDDIHVVVSLPEFNTSFMINIAASVTWGYVSEKMTRSGRRENACDSSAIAHMLSMVLKIPALVHTDDDGRWCDQERWVG